MEPRGPPDGRGEVTRVHRGGEERGHRARIEEPARFEGGQVSPVGSGHPRVATPGERVVRHRGQSIRELRGRDPFGEQLGKEPVQQVSAHDAAVPTMDLVPATFISGHMREEPPACQEPGGPPLDP